MSVRSNGAYHYSPDCFLATAVGQVFRAIPPWNVGVRGGGG